MADHPANELELQRRWAESDWPTPFLPMGSGGAIRVISPGRWNHGPGPDFHGAQILDEQGRARRGDVELHIDPSDWLQHGHSADPAYRDLLLHVVERAPRNPAKLDPRIPDATTLPPATTDSVEAPPCAEIVQRVGAPAVKTRLLQIAQRRFIRKTAELHALRVPTGPGTEADRRAVIAVARALGQPHNATLAQRAAEQTLDGTGSWERVQPRIEAADWRRGRGALGSPNGLSLVLTTLLQRWTTAGSAPWATFERLASLPRREAVDELRIAKQLGSARAVQLLADAVYPLTQSWRQWLRLPGARYQRTDELRARLDYDAQIDFGWRHPHTQALLELEQTRCRQWACRVCPLAGLARGSGSGRENRRA